MTLTSKGIATACVEERERVIRDLASSFEIPVQASAWNGCAVCPEQLSARLPASRESRPFAAPGAEIVLPLERVTPSE